MMFEGTNTSIGVLCRVAAKLSADEFVRVYGVSSEFKLKQCTRLLQVLRARSRAAQ